MATENYKSSYTGVEIDNAFTAIKALTNYLNAISSATGKVDPSLIKILASQISGVIPYADSAGTSIDSANASNARKGSALDLRITDVENGISGLEDIINNQPTISKLANTINDLTTLSGVNIYDLVFVQETQSVYIYGRGDKTKLTDWTCVSKGNIEDTTSGTKTIDCSHVAYYKLSSPTAITLKAVDLTKLPQGDRTTVITFPTTPSMTFTNTLGVYFKGDDCTNGVFTPVNADALYELNIWYNGFQWCGTVVKW